MRQRSSDRARIRRLRAQYRKRMAIVAIIFLILGFVLGIVADKALFTRKDTTAEPELSVTPTPEAVEQQGDEDVIGSFGDDIDGFNGDTDVDIPDPDDTPAGN